MPEVTDYKELLASICEEWDRAEKDIKIAEQIGNQVVFPSIKELRYAGRRLVDALHRMASGAAEEEVRALLEDARFNCFRARHDAIDATVSTMAIEIELFAKTLGYDVVLTAFPDYPKLLESLRETREKIAESRQNRENRDVIYRNMEKIDFGRLVQSYGDFAGASDIMRQMARRSRVNKVIDRSLGIGGLIIGIVAVVVAFLLAP